MIIKMNSTDNSRVKLVKEVVRLQSEMGRVFGPHSSEAWMDLNLTIGQLKTLFFLAFEGSTSLGKLAEALNVTPPNVTGIVERLVEQGLVSRDENPENRRMLLLTLTDAGKNLLSDLRHNDTRYMNNLFKKLSDDDLKALAQGLRAVLEVSKEFTDRHNPS